MGRLVEINKHERIEERVAQERLANILPEPWIVTTNIGAFNFRKRSHRRELDCMLISPLGAFVIDFKSHPGQITPLANEEWRGLTYKNKKEVNPFEQGEKGAISVRNRLAEDHPEHPWFLEWLIVLTNPNAVLDWAGSNCKDFQRPRVCLIDDVEKHIGILAQGLGFKPDARQAQLILETFAAKDLPSHADYIEKHWPARAAEQNRSHARRQESVRPQPPPSQGSSSDESSWFGEPEETVLPEPEELIPPRPDARGGAPHIPGQTRETQKPSRPPPQDQAAPGVGWKSVLNPITGYALGLAASAFVAIYGANAVYQLTTCDGACESRRAARAQQERTARAISEQARAQAQQPAQDQLRLYYMRQRNISPNCPGQEIVSEETGRWRDFNPHHCAVMWTVMEGRMALKGVYPQMHWEIWPGGGDPDIQLPVEVRSTRETAKWRYILCESDTDRFKKAAKEGRFECS